MAGQMGITHHNIFPRLSAQTVGCGGSARHNYLKRKIFSGYKNINVGIMFSRHAHHWHWRACIGWCGMMKTKKSSWCRCLFFALSSGCGDRDDDLATRCARRQMMMWRARSRLRYRRRKNIRHVFIASVCGGALAVSPWTR